uniref:hypothetical protein n=1 Tax=Arthrobacter sp. Hiyo1 TaxID=1588020 RepID=UPI00209C4BE2
MKKPSGVVPIALFLLVSGFTVGVPLPAHADTTPAAREDRYVVHYAEGTDVDGKTAELRSQGVSVDKNVHACREGRGRHGDASEGRCVGEVEPRGIGRAGHPGSDF